MKLDGITIFGITFIALTFVFVAIAAVHHF